MNNLPNCARVTSPLTQEMSALVRIIGNRFLDWFEHRCREQTCDPERRFRAVCEGYDDSASVALSIQLQRHKKRESALLYALGGISD